MHDSLEQPGREFPLHVFDTRYPVIKNSDMSYAWFNKYCEWWEREYAKVISKTFARMFVSRDWRKSCSIVLQELRNGDFSHSTQEIEALINHPDYSLDTDPRNNAHVSMIPALFSKILDPKDLNNRTMITALSHPLVSQFSEGDKDRKMAEFVWTQSKERGIGRLDENLIHGTVASIVSRRSNFFPSPSNISQAI